MVTVALPDPLREASQRELAGGVTRASAGALSDRYRDRSATGPRARSREDVAAYAATRLPATYAAVTRVLAEAQARSLSFAPRSQLDLGAGLGAALWAAAETWPSLEQMTAIEREPEMLAAGRRVAASGPAPVATSRWVRADAGTVQVDGPFDLVTISYMLNELDPRAAVRALETAWAATASGGVLVVVEPGSPDGSRSVLAARERLLELGGFTLAPCPHDRACPLAAPDWCHFAVRLPRSAQHRRAKRAQLGYEDEKFAYTVIAREEMARAPARILRRPLIRPGHVRLALCAEGGLCDAVVSKRDRDAFDVARKASWGDALDDVPT